MKVPIIDIQHREIKKSERIEATSKRKIVRMLLKNTGQDPVKINNTYMLSADESLPICSGSFQVLKASFDIKFSELLPDQKLSIWEEVLIGFEEL